MHQANGLFIEGMLSCCNSINNRKSFLWQPLELVTSKPFQFGTILRTHLIQLMFLKKSGNKAFDFSVCFMQQHKQRNSRMYKKYKTCTCSNRLLDLYIEKSIIV